MTHRQAQQQLRQRSQPEPWPWPLDLTAYDRQPGLSEAEQTELDRIALQGSQVHQESKRILQRFVLPLNDAFTYLRAGYNTIYSTTRLIFIQMQRSRVAFWRWTDQDWLDMICSTPEEFYRKHGISAYGGRSPRSSLSALVYLLCPHISIDPLLPKEISTLARKVFGEEAIELAGERILTVLRGWGYQQKTGEFMTCVNYLLLKSRSPHLEHVTGELLLEAQRSPISRVAAYIFQVSRGLAGIGIIPKPLPGPSAPRKLSTNSDESVSPEWVSWCERWRSHSTYQRKRGVFYALLSAGRWLKVTHPEITTPAQWSYELAIEFIAAVNGMKVGEWANPALRERLFAADRIGQPLRPYSKVRLIAATRTFFRDCQEWEWIPRLFNPARALRTPTSLNNLTGPDPRVIDKDLWAKILWAAMNLQLADLPVGGHPNDAPVYPLAIR